MLISFSDVKVWLKSCLRIWLKSCQIWLKSCLAEELFADIMFSGRKSVIMFAFMTLPVPCFCAPRGTALRQAAKNIVYPKTSDSSLGEYERKTQSPMIWVKLHKTELSSSTSVAGVGEEQP